MKRLISTKLEINTNAVCMDFYRHLNIEGNEKILFSGKYGVPLAYISITILQGLFNNGDFTISQFNSPASPDSEKAIAIKGGLPSGINNNSSMKNNKN